MRGVQEIEGEHFKNRIPCMKCIFSSNEVFPLKHTQNPIPRKDHVLRRVTF